MIRLRSCPQQGEGCEGAEAAQHQGAGECGKEEGEGTAEEGEVEDARGARLLDADAAVAHERRHVERAEVGQVEGDDEDGIEEDASEHKEDAAAPKGARFGQAEGEDAWWRAIGGRGGRRGVVFGQFLLKFGPRGTVVFVLDDVDNVIGEAETHLRPHGARARRVGGPRGEGCVRDMRLYDDFSARRWARMVEMVGEGRLLEAVVSRTRCGDRGTDEEP